VRQVVRTRDGNTSRFGLGGLVFNIPALCAVYNLRPVGARVDSEQGA
jgi:hypothetical protein